MMNKLFFIFLIVLAGCRLGPKYSPPPVSIPEEWKNPQSCTGSNHFCNYWWEVFHDETLNELELYAILYNPNLQAALERIVQARAMAGVDKSVLYPQVNLNPSYLSTGELFKIYLPSVPAGQTTPFANIPKVFRIHQLQYTLPLNLSFEIDLWKKLQSQYESAVFFAEAQEEAYHTALLSLTTDLASAYFQLRSLLTQIDLLKHTIELRKKAYDLADMRFKAGLITYLDVAQASVELTNAESQYFDTERQKELQENQIALLIGMPASDFNLTALPLESAPPCVPAGLPSEVLMQRPDIAQAERDMASEHAKIGVAYASFFPSLQLTGTLGFFSPDTKDFLSWKSRLWQVGANVAQTVFDGGRNCSNLELAYSQYREAADNYKQTVLTAFKEVEDALNNLEMQAKQSESLKKSVDASQIAARLSMNRYQRGVVNYLEVVETQRSELENEREYINLQGVRYLSTIQLIKALGGCW